MKPSRICISACLCLLLGCEEAYQYPDIHESQLQHGVTMLHVAASQGQCRKINQQLARGTDVNVRNDGGDTPLHSASTNGHLDAIKLLIKHGAKVNARNTVNQTPLNFAARRGSLAAVKYLVEHGAVINTEQNTPLNDAAAYGPFISSEMTNQRIDMMKYFLDHGVNVNGRGNCGFTQGNGDYTPLHAAALHASPEILQLLIDRGAEVDATSPGGITPLFHAALGGNAAAAKILLESGANVNFRRDSGSTPLTSAVGVNNVGHANAQTAKVLIDYGADVNVQERNLTTPLHMAVQNYSLDGPRIVEILLDAGADIYAKDCSGRTPLSMAKNGRNQEILALLQRHATRSNYIPPQENPQNSQSPRGGR